MIGTTLIHRILKRPFLILNMFLSYAVISHEALSQPQDAAMVIMGGGSSFQGGGGQAIGMRIHPTTNTHQSEMSIAVSPWNNKKVLASANTSNYPVSVLYGTGYYISTDGGINWTGNDIPPTGNNRGDPAVVIDTLGYFYIGSIAPNYGQGIMKSTNSGSTWQYIQVANPQVPNDPNVSLDKNHLAVDNSTISSYRGNLYSGWSDFGFADRRITVARSTDRGQTWVSQQAISVGLADNMGHQGVNLQAGPDGRVYACWAVRDRVAPFTERGIGFNVSTNGGASW
ncbi:MAG: WD40/YVTN/BNR-like repeat-containing protein [bacterium]